MLQPQRTNARLNSLTNRVRQGEASRRLKKVQKAADLVGLADLGVLVVWEDLAVPERGASGMEKESSSGLVEAVMRELRAETQPLGRVQKPWLPQERLKTDLAGDKENPGGR